MCTDWRREKKNWYEASGSWNEFVKHASEINFVFFWSFIDFIVQGLVADLGERPGEGDPCPSIFWVKKEEMTEGRKAGRASKIEPGPLLSSKSGSVTVWQPAHIFFQLTISTRPVPMGLYTDLRGYAKEERGSFPWSSETYNFLWETKSATTIPPE